MIECRAFPMDNTDYLAEDLRKWFFTRTTGVFSADDNLQVTANGNMTVTVSPGIAYINDGNGGLVEWVGHASTLAVSTADNMLDRIDTVVLRYDKKLNKILLDLVKGDLSENPVPKPPVRDSNAYEIVLAQVRVEMGTGAITTDKLKDTRLDESVCGLMRDGVNGIPTQALYDQFIAREEAMRQEFLKWFDTMKGKLSDDPATALYDTLQYEYYGMESTTDNTIHGSTGAGKVCVDVLGNTVQEWMDLAEISEPGTFNWSTGKITQNAEIKTRFRTKTCFAVQPNTEYSAECIGNDIFIACGDAEYNAIKEGSVEWGKKLTFTTLPNCQYIRIMIRVNDKGTEMSEITGKLRLSCVTEPSIEAPLMLESAGNRKNLVDVNQLSIASLAPDSTGWNKIKILLDNGTYTWSIKENHFLGNQAFAILTNDPGYTGSSNPNKYWYSWIGSNDVAASCSTTRPFTITDGYAYLAISGAGLTLSKLPDFLPEFQIEKGSLKTSYLPADKYEITLNSCGKNLINARALDKMEQVPEATRIRKKRIYLKNGVYTWSRGEMKTTDDIYYCITDDVNYGASDIADGCFTSWIYQSDNLSRCHTEGSFTVTKGYIFICYRLTCEIEKDMPDFQIEYGEKKTSYEAYQEDTQALVLDEPLRSLGDVCDEIKDGKLIRRVGRIVVDGNTTNLAVYSNNYIVTYAAISGMNIYGGELKCDKLPYVRNWNITEHPNCVYANEKLLIGIAPELTGCLPNETGATALPKFKAFLDAHPLEILYKLKDPIIEDYPAVTIRSFPNHTTIRTDYEVSPLLHSSFNRHEAEITEIQELKNSSAQYVQKGEFVFIIGQLLTPEAGSSGLSGQTIKNYPAGFTKDNCVVISLMGNRPDSNDSWSTTYQPNAMGYVMGNGGLYAILQSDSIIVRRIKSDASEPAKMNNFKLVLMKIQ